MQSSVLSETRAPMMRTILELCGLSILSSQLSGLVPALNRSQMIYLKSQLMLNNLRRDLSIKTPKLSLHGQQEIWSRTTRESETITFSNCRREDNDI